MTQLDSADIVLSIAVFLDEKSDLKNWSLVNRVCYESLTRRRARHLQVDPSGLPSLALFLIRNDAFQYCRSFKLTSGGASSRQALSTEDRRFEAPLQAFSEALILRVIGNSEGEGLQFFEGSCDEYTPHLLWQVMGAQDGLKARKCTRDNCIKLSSGLEEEEQHIIGWFSPDGSSSLGDFRCVGEEQDSRIRTQRVHLPPALRNAKAFLNPKVMKIREPSVPQPVCDELLKSSRTIEELSLRFKNPSTWKRILLGDWHRLTRLNVHILTPQFLEPAFPRPVGNFHMLQTLKISLAKNQRVPNLMLDLTFPNLRSLHFSGGNIEASVLSEFLTRHAHLLHDVALDCNMVPGIQRLKKLRGLHLGSDQRSSIVYMQLGVWTTHLPNVVQLRVPEMSFTVLVKTAFPHYRTTNINPTWPQNLRCLELEYVRVERLADFLRGTIPLPPLSGLKELALIIVEEKSSGPLLQKLIPLVLKKCAGLPSLMAVRFACKGKGEVSLSGLTRDSSTIPKELKYIVTDLGGVRRTIRVSTVLVGSGILNPREGLIFDEVPPLRPLPLPGKWTVDWTDESIYDHTYPNYKSY